MTGVFIKPRNLDTDRYGGKMIWRDTGRRQPSTNQRERLGTDPSLTALRRNPPYQHREFRIVLP